METDKIIDLLDEEIEKELSELSSMPAGSKEKSVAIDALVELYKLRIEETKNDREHFEKYDFNETENSFKRDQLREQIMDRYVKLGIAAAELVLPLIFYGVWMRKGLKFEETGTFTSTTFKGFINRFKPTKKN